MTLAGRGRRASRILSPCETATWPGTFGSFGRANVNVRPPAVNFTFTVLLVLVAVAFGTAPFSPR